MEHRRAWQMVNEFPRMLGRPRVEVRALCGLGAAYAACGKVHEAEISLKQVPRLIETVAENPGHWVFDSSIAQLMYHAAVAYLRSGDRARALATLQNACECGWRDATLINTDPEFKSLHGERVLHQVETHLAGLPRLVVNLPRHSMISYGNAD